MFQKNITVNSRKFDGKIHRSWHGQLLEKSDKMLLLVGEFKEEVKHQHLGVIRRGTTSYEFYWFNRFFNIFRFHEPDGSFRNFYCNINLPPKFNNGVLDYIDLDVDVLVWKNFSYQILDTDEFEQNAEKFSYTSEMLENVTKALSELTLKIENRLYPFDYKV